MGKVSPASCRMYVRIRLWFIVLCGASGMSNEIKVQKSDRLVKPAQNRSLERGVSILRAFRSGISVMGNKELAERTNLSAATVSRLTQTLVRTGLLDYDPRERAYRLSASVLSLAHAVTYGSPILRFSTPLIRQTAKKYSVNIGFATRDMDAMVYLSVERFNNRTSYRNVVPGRRVPIESSSLGHAYLSTMPSRERREFLDIARRNHQDRWRELNEEIERSLEMIRRRGYCTLASWQPGFVALATPIHFARYPAHVLNASIPVSAVGEQTSQDQVSAILALARSIESGEDEA